VVAGSGALERYGSGTFGWPFEIWALAWSSRLARHPFVLLDIGVQSHPTALARFFVRGAANAASYRSYRDAPSREAMRAMGVRNAGLDPVVTDMAFTFHPVLPSRSPSSAVVLGVMDYRRRDSAQDESGDVRARYESSCVELVRVLRARGRVVRLVGGADDDLIVARQIARTLNDGTAVLDVNSPEELVAEMSSADVVVASRYHTLILALVAGTPVVSIGYGEKHRAMLEQFDLPDSHSDIESFDPEEIAITIEALASERTALSLRINARLKTARELLEDQWRDVDVILRSRKRKER
jgi:polysaccharide pyruvyl transferase WcaK-like protein